METVNFGEASTKLTEDQLDAAFVVWRAGGDIHELADAFGEDRAVLAWFFIMRNGGQLANYNVHYGVTN